MKITQTPTHYSKRLEDPCCEQFDWLINHTSVTSFGNDCDGIYVNRSIYDYSNPEHVERNKTPFKYCPYCGTLIKMEPLE